MTPQKALKFAPLIRVSSEAKAKRGESLNIQRQQIEQAIKTLNGRIYKMYSGQEHATPEQDRKLLTQFMEDAKGKKFDAIMVTDVSRWSRDNMRSKQDLEILKKNGIKFYVLSQEYDLYKADQNFIIGLGVEVHEYYAKQQAEKCLAGRIARAEKGEPGVALTPFGRHFDKETRKWSVDENAKKLAERVAEMYLKGGKSFKAISREFGKAPSWSYKLLFEQSGDTWIQHFHSKLTNIHRDIPSKIPHLLSQKLLDRIKVKAFDKRWQDYGVRKYPYLFSRLVFDAKTKYALTGTTYSGHSYYAPYKEKGSKIRADLLENDVMEKLFDFLGGSKSLFEIMFPKPKRKMLEELEGKRNSLQEELNSVDRQRNNLSAAIQRFEKEDVASYLETLSVRIKDLEIKRKEIQGQMEIVNEKMASLPSREEAENLASELEQRLKERRLMSGEGFSELPFEERKRIVNLLFSGKDEDGRKFGIYVSANKEGENRSIKWEAHGHFGTLAGDLNSVPPYLKREIASTIGPS